MGEMPSFAHVLRRHFWAVPLSLVACAAFLNARAIGALVASELAPGGDELSRAGVRLAAPPAIPADGHATSADPILRHNPFGPPFEGTSDDADAGAPPNEIASCAGFRAHIVVASDDPDWSFASLLAPGADPRPVLRRRGGAVGDREVAFVGADRVWLKSSTGALCEAKVFGPHDEPKGPLEVKPPVRDAGALDPNISRGIARTGPRDWQMDRGVVDRIIEQYAELMKGTVVAPDRENGKVVGIRVFGIRPDSVLALLGIENGDRIVTVNGFDLTDPGRALEALGYVRTAPRLNVDLRRNGQPLTLNYEVR